MVTKFPKFSQALAQDPATRRIWYGLATAHDFESHDGMTEENLYQKIFASHFGHLAIIFFSVNYGIMSESHFIKKVHTVGLLLVWH
jgi:photosystem I P700 chlorophyll a apoprotein A2